MKCPNCGAEIKEGSNYCEFCSSQISLDMKREQEQLNKKGCPKCGSTNISFTRETQGQVKDKKSTSVIHSTVGVCNDCGYSWHAEGNAQPEKKRKTWLWVLGWIFIFPVPLTILMLRPTNKLDKKIRYAIIAVAWLVYAVWIIGSGDSSGSSSNSDLVQSEKATTEESSEVKDATIEAEVVSTEEKATEEYSVDEEESSSVEEPVENAASNETSETDESKVTPELKEFLDSYEAFMDEYCEFLESYDSSDATMLLEYAQMMKKYEEFSEKADKYDDKDMTTADSAYYLEVMTRINNKLAKVSIAQ